MHKLDSISAHPVLRKNSLERKLIVEKSTNHVTELMFTKKAARFRELKEKLVNYNPFQLEGRARERAERRQTIGTKTESRNRELFDQEKERKKVYLES